MRRYRKKPIVIDAFRLGRRGMPTPAPAWFGTPDPDSITAEGLLLRTPEGVMLARWGDWIIRGVRGEIYPCNPWIFHATYEIVEEPDPITVPPPPETASPDHSR